MERDDLIVNDQYSLDAHHGEEEGKKIRKKIIWVTILLSLITAVEVGVGVMFNRMEASEGVWTAIKWGYIVLTLAKAFYIVKVFMHLGDERKALRYTIVIPYAIFIVYLIFILTTEGAAVGEIFSW